MLIRKTVLLNIGESLMANMAPAMQLSKSYNHIKVNRQRFTIVFWTCLLILHIAQAE